ncbi:MAG: polysaccharide deacetylase family protein [Firmicutes bacterium]|nr:polysaccharide deacetylase family protein [Bacillota bacterium]
MRIVLIKIKKLFIFWSVTIVSFLIILICTAKLVGIFAHQSDEEVLYLPVIMYHSILINPKKNIYIISKDLFRQDLEYLKENGYTTILVKNLIRYTENKEDLPEKIILLSFDDGAFNNFKYAFPLVQQYGMSAVVAPIGHLASMYTDAVKKIEEKENVEYSHASWPHLKEMADSGLVEIQNHTYKMHEIGDRLGCKKKKNESLEEYEKKFVSDISKAQNIISEKIGVTPTAFFYPFGACSKCSVNILKKMGFKATFLCESKINKIKRDPESLFGLYRFLRDPEIPSSKFFKNILK